jgi:hypothetical protein
MVLSRIELAVVVGGVVGAVVAGLITSEQPLFAVLRGTC